jgi:hypothetical protein
MKKKVVGILIVGIMITTLFPCIGASLNNNIQKEDITEYESYIFGIGFVRINGFTHVIKGFVLFGINDGEVIKTEFINIKYNDVNEVFASYLSPLMFLMRYNPA